MPIVECFAPPAYLPDLDSVPGLRQQWHAAVSAWFDDAIATDVSLAKPGPFQFYNPARFDPGGSVVEQEVTWNAFPKALVRLFGRDRALEEADKLWTLDRYFNDLQNFGLTRNDYPGLFKCRFRPQDEYCEWRVERDPGSNLINRVTFTSEPPELWLALFGNRVPDDRAKYEFAGDRKGALARYHEFVGAGVCLEDLIATEDIESPNEGRFAKAGDYNVYNKWNSTHGIVHLCAPPNYLSAEIQLAADASVPRKNPAGQTLVEAEALICAADYGGPNRNSDPTIGASVNAAVRLGAFVTLKNPVGLYMDHIDLSGWEAPDKKSVADCIHIVRGTVGMIERLVVEVPCTRGFLLGDINIAGEKIEYGGQIAECITVKLIAQANLTLQPVANKPVPGPARYEFKRGDPNALLFRLNPGTPPERGFVEAFAGQGVEEEPAVRQPQRAHHNLRGRSRRDRRKH